MPAIVDNGYVNEAGVRRRFPVADARCSTDIEFVSWVAYADGTVMEFAMYTTEGDWGAQHVDIFGREVPYPWYFTFYEPGVATCEFFGV